MTMTNGTTKVIVGNQIWYVDEEDDFAVILLLDRIGTRHKPEYNPEHRIIGYETL